MSDPYPSKSDAIIVLGCPARDDGQPSSTMKARVKKAVELFYEGYAPTIIFSGAAVSNEFVEAEVMASYAKTLGVPESVLIRETEARDTIQNVRNSVKIMREYHWHSALVVTSPYHTRRTRELFSQLDVEIDVVAAEHPYDLKWYDRSRAILHEYFLLLWYKVSGEKV